VYRLQSTVWPYSPLSTCQLTSLLLLARRGYGGRLLHWLASYEKSERCASITGSASSPRTCRTKRRIFGTTDQQTLDLAPPAEAGVLPVQICASFVIKSCKFGINISLVALAVVPFHVEHQGDAQDQDYRRSGQVQSIADRVVGCIVRYECPCGDQTADVA
jgi:hypothetical protein